MIPSPSAAQQGVGVISGDQFNTFTQNCNTASQLRALIGLPTMYVNLGGINVIGDGNGGIFYWSASATGPDDDLNVIVPYATASGAWLRLPTSAYPGVQTIRTTTVNTTLLPTDGILEVDATTLYQIITVPVSLGSPAGGPVKTILKIDPTTNPVILSTDGTLANEVARITSQNTAGGTGWLNVIANGTNLRVWGAP
jgi:hypothetical protein